MPHHRGPSRRNLSHLRRTRAPKTRSTRRSSLRCGVLRRFCFWTISTTSRFLPAVLESLLTEDSRARILGGSSAADLGAAIFAVITGNGVGVRGDAARRFVECFFDAGSKNPASAISPAGIFKPTSRAIETRSSRSSDRLALGTAEQDQARPSGRNLRGVGSLGARSFSGVGVHGRRDHHETKHGERSWPRTGNQRLSHMVGSPQGRARPGLGSR